MHSRNRFDALKMGFVLAIGIALLATNVHAATMSFNADRDAPFIAGGSLGNDNYGANEILATGKVASNEERSIVSFDVSGLDGQYDEITGITLRLTGSGSNAGSNTQTTEVYAVTAANRAWNEGDNIETSDPEEAGDVTWNARQHPGTAWAGSAGASTPGVDYNATLLASQTFAPASLPADGDVVDFTFAGTPAELTSLIDTWLVDNVDLSQPNAGLLLLDPNASGFAALERVRYHSRDSATTSAHPLLIVEFSEFSVPEPGSLGTWTVLGLVGWTGRRRRPYRG